MDSLIKLVNLPVKIEFDGKEYEVPKANLLKVAKFQQRAKQMMADGTSTEPGIAAYAIFLILEGTVDGITEEAVLEKFPGSFDYQHLLQQLGFLKAKEETATPENQTSESSS